MALRDGPERDSPDVLPADLRLVYDEYVRTDAKLEQMIYSSFDDIKLLGAVVIVLGSTPLAEYLSGPVRGLSDEVKLLCYLGMFAVVAVLAFRDLMKQAIIFRLLGEAEICASILAEHLEQRIRAAFAMGPRSRRWLSECYMRVARRFVCMFLLPATVLPATTLRERPAFVVTYLAVVTLTTVLFAATSALTLRPPAPT